VQGGSLAIRGAKPRWTDGHVRVGFGNSTNNQGIGGGGGGIGSGCPTVPGDDSCVCIDCFECPSGMPRQQGNYLTCCEAIVSTCLAWDPDTQDPEMVCLWHWHKKPGCIYNVKQFEEWCLWWLMQNLGGRRRHRMPGGPVYPPPGGSDPPDRKGRGHVRYCSDTQLRNLSWARWKMCNKSHDGACISSQAPTTASCIWSFCHGDYDFAIWCLDGNKTLPTDPVLILLKVPDDVDCSKDPWRGECLNLVNSLFHELIHACQDAQPGASECRAERIVDGCILLCGSGVGIAGGTVQGCPKSCAPMKSDCVDEHEYLPFRPECGDCEPQYGLGGGGDGGGGGW